MHMSTIESDANRIESRQIWEALMYIGAMLVITFLVFIEEADGAWAAWFIEGIILGNEGVSAFRIAESARTPKQGSEPEKKSIVRGRLPTDVESSQFVEIVVSLAGMGLLCLMAWKGHIPGETVTSLVGIVIAVFCGVSGGRIVLDRKGLVKSNLAIRAIGGFFTESGDSSPDEKNPSSSPESAEQPTTNS